MSEWQPITTAPKDGTEIIVAARMWLGNYHTPQIKIVPKIAKFSTFDGYWRCSESNAENLNLNPSYWIPLPEILVDPPKT